jgi:glycosyltransferase involved in cell wall biosynthesis
MAPRLVVVTTSPAFPPRGDHERRTLDFCYALAEQAADVTIVCFGDGVGVGVARLARGLRQLTVGRSDPAAAQRFTDVCRDACWGADAVIATSAAVVSSVASLWNGLLVLDLGDAAAPAVNDAVAAAVSLVLVSSGEAAARLEAGGKIARDAIVAVPPIVEPQTFRPPDRATRRLHRRMMAAEPVALFVAGAGAAALAAGDRIAAVAAQMPDVRFVFGGELSGAFAQHARPANLSLLAPLQEESSRWIHAIADVVLLPLDGDAGAVLDAVVGGGTPVGPRSAFDVAPHLVPFVELVDGDDWSGAIRRALERSDAEAEDRARGAQRAVEERHAPLRVVGPLLARIVALATPSDGEAQRPTPRVVVTSDRALFGRRARYEPLGGGWDVVMCSSSETATAGEELVVAPNVLERRVPHGAFLHRSGPGYEPVAWLEPAYGDLLARSLRGARVAIAAGPSVHAALRAGWSGPIVYDAQQVEYVALAARFADSSRRDPRLQHMAEIEGRCVRDAALVVVACREDAELVAELYGVERERIAVCPPGIEGAVPRVERPARVRAKAASSLAGKTVAVFAAETSEVRGAVELAEIARVVPEVLFLVLGEVAASATAELGGRRPENLQFTGPLDEATYRSILGLADLAVHPGGRMSGASAGIGDSVGTGLPLLVTPTAARGWNLVDGQDAHVVGLAEFPARIRAVLADLDGAESRTVRLRERLEREGGGAALARLVQERFGPVATGAAR